MTIKVWHLLTVMIVTLGISGALIQHTYEQGKGDMVYLVCEESRQSPTIKEEQCANLQDATGKEFVCEQANPLPTNKCKVINK